MKRMLSQDVAYMAGVFDGEGWFVGSDHADPGAFIAMCDFDVIDKLHEMSGLGRMETPRATITGKKLQKKWAISKHEEVEEFIYAVLPFLGERRSARAKEVLAQIEKRRARREWREVYFVCGHEKTEENTYHTNQGKTICRECSLERVAVRYKANKEK